MVSEGTVLHATQRKTLKYEIEKKNTTGENLCFRGLGLEFAATRANHQSSYIMGCCLAIWDSAGINNHAMRPNPMARCNMTCLKQTVLVDLSEHVWQTHGCWTQRCVGSLWSVNGVCCDFRSGLSEIRERSTINHPWGTHVMTWPEQRGARGKGEESGTYSIVLEKTMPFRTGWWQNKRMLLHTVVLLQRTFGAL